MHPEIRIETRTTVEVCPIIVVMIVAILGAVAMATTTHAATSTCMFSTASRSVSPSSDATTIVVAPVVPHATCTRAAMPARNA
jgi:hypothetical protein